MKACIKFLSVLLIVTMCVGFMPAAFADGSGAIVIGPSFSSTTSEPSAGTPADKATASPSPSDPAGGKQDADKKAAEDEAGEDEEDEEAPEALSAASAAELRAAVKTVKAFGTVTVTASISDLTAPLVIGKSLTLDLCGNTLTFGPEGGSSYGAAIQIASGVDEVFICDGTVETTVTVDELTENIFGYSRYISSGADSLILSGVDFDGTLTTEGSLLSFEEDGSLAVEAGDRFSWDPSAYVDPDLFTVSYDEENEVWIVAEKADAEPDPEEEKSEDGTQTKDDPEKQEDPNKAEDPQTGTEAEIQDEPKDDTPVSEPVTVSSQEDLDAALADPAKTEITVAEGSKLSGVEIMRSLSLNLSGASLSGTVLVTNNAAVTISGGSISGKIINTGALTLNGVSVSAGSASGIASLFGSASGACIENNGGALTLAGGSVVGDITVSGGSFTVNDDSVQAGTVSVSGSAVVNISGGQFNSLVAVDGYDPIAYVSNGEVMSDGIMPTAGTGLIGNVTGGHFVSIKPLEAFVHDPYTLGEDGGIMLMSLGPDNNAKGGAVALADGSPSSYVGSGEGKLSFGVYYKGAPASQATAAYVISLQKVDELGGNDATIESITAAPQGEVDGTTLVSGTDFTYTPNSKDATTGGTVKLINGGTALEGRKAGLYNLTFNTKDKLGAGNLTAQLFVVPELEYKNPSFTMGKSNEFKFALEEGDNPTTVTAGLGTKHSTDANELTSGTDYEHTGGNFTLKGDYIKNLRVLGQYYVGLWYGSVPVYVPFKITSATWVSPTETTWTYNSGKDLTFKVTPPEAVITEVRNHTKDDTVLNSSQYYVKDNVITLNASYLQSLVDRTKGTGHGITQFMFKTESGEEVSFSVNIRPAMWAKDGKDTHTRGTDGTLTYEFSSPIVPGAIPTLNGHPLTSDDYVLNSDYSITLKADFLNKRTGANSYPLTVATQAGDVTADVKLSGTVRNTTTNGVNTGDVNNPAIWAIVLVLSGAAAVTLMVPKKKKSQGE